jgi:hypothetical protein
MSSILNKNTNNENLTEKEFRRLKFNNYPRIIYVRNEIEYIK